LKGLSEKYKLSCFLSGLRDDIRLPLRMLKPQDLNEAFGLAKIQEEYVLSTRRSYRPSGYILLTIFSKGKFFSGRTTTLKLSPVGGVKTEVPTKGDMGLQKGGFKPNIPIQKSLKLKWRRGEKRVSVIIVMKNITLPIDVLREKSF
jgi:hypothetical protein